VEEDDRPPLPLVEVGDAQLAELAIARLEGEVGQSAQALLGRADRVNGRAA